MTRSVTISKFCFQRLNHTSSRNFTPPVWKREQGYLSGHAPLTSVNSSDSHNSPVKYILLLSLQINEVCYFQLPKLILRLSFLEKYIYIMYIQYIHICIQIYTHKWICVGKCMCINALNMCLCIYIVWYILSIIVHCSF